ncbi:hypothetical protein NQ317_009397 [Molorchus minor]|uniref:Uncharacterized protein n=1 Tax=Molorchus minor TaxID=1323400 RepID=A0ABQ9JRT3_9CUCU|nr:hypothetical protein NQ317_009397 [Molorchus minor]
MPSFCSVLNCGMRAERDRVSFFRFPAVLRHRGEYLNGLSEERHNAWVKALKRGALSEARLKHWRVCSRHFVNGAPAELENDTHPDWIPRQNMGYASSRQPVQTTDSREEKLTNRKQIIHESEGKMKRGSKYFNINAVESFTGFMPYRDQLTTCIPEMALDLIPNPVICNTCRTALKSAYDFKSRCLLIEKKIRDEPLEKDVSPTIIAAADSELLLQLQREVILPASGEIEITNITRRRGRGHARRKVYLETKDGLHICGKCGMTFPDIGKLLLHKAVHGDEFICNFCNRAFKSLQYLRRHNNICSKIKNKVDVNPPLTKRPQLPTKAKNHLKRWLFKHTEHPYPSDHEKQMLMQETNLSLLQVENWFINARRRILQDLTKLKSHGVHCDDIGKDVMEFHTDVDLEEINVPQGSESPTTSTDELANIALKMEEVEEDDYTSLDIMAVKDEPGER